MNQNAKKAPRLRRTRNQIEVLLQEFENSNMNIPQFCKSHSVSTTTLHKWQSRYRSKVERIFKPAGFAKLNITSSVSNGQGTLFAEVQGIKLYQPVSASYLKELAFI